MNSDNQIPENDRDLRLARMIREFRDSDNSLERIDDPLMPLLLQFKESDLAEFREISPNSSSIWSSIENGIQRENTPVYKILPQTDLVRWIAAAAIVILSLTMFYWLFERNEPELIASTEQTISTVTLTDGSSVTLRPHSELYRISISSDAHVYSVSGEAYFEVVSTSEREFIAETDDGRVVVLGTKFILQNWSGRTSVFLEDGRIRFETTDQSSSAFLEPGQFSTISDNQITTPARENSQVFKDWLENMLVLENQPAKVVLSEIEQHFGVSINAEEVQEETLGGSIQLDNLDQVLQDLAIVLGGTFQRTEENSYTYVPRN